MIDTQPESRCVQIVRLSQASEDALRLLHEYYDALSIIQRDTPQAIQNILDEENSGLWLAYLGETAVGCVMLRKLESITSAVECKRLYVQPLARGHRIADKMLDAQENYARSKALHWIYLDSHDGLTTAIALYLRRGYVPCERYNDNPQATLFLRKYIGPS